MSKPKGLSSEKTRYKLPPRLAKQKAERDREREKNKNFMPKIENWDNELANNIPAHSDNTFSVMDIDPKSE